MKKRKILCAVMAVLLLLSCLTVSAVEDKGVVFTVGSAEVDVESGTVALPVSVTDNSGHAGGDITITSELELLGFDDADSKFDVIANAKSGKINWSFAENTTATGELVKAVFAIPETAKAGDNFEVAVSVTELIDASLSTVKYSVTNGQVSITKADENAPKIIVSSVKANHGKEIDVDILIENNPGIVTMGLNVNYDSELTLTKVTDAGVLGSNLHNTNLALYPYYLKWENYTVRDNFKSNGKIVTLTFKVPDNAEENDFYPIYVSYEKGNFEIINVNLEEVGFTTISGGITVKKYMIGDVNNDEKVNNLDVAILSRYLAKWEGYEKQIVSWEAADINSDGKVNNIDVALVSRYLAKWEGYSEYFEQ